MAYENEMILILRNLIGDVDSSDYTYDDARLLQVIIISAHLLLDEVDFENSYSINTIAMTISPDPTLSGSRDESFINLVSIKSAILILRSEFKVAGSQAIKVIDGPSQIDMTNVFRASKEVLTEMQKTLDLAVLRYKIGTPVGQSILTPFVVSSISGRGRIF